MEKSDVSVINAILYRKDRYKLKTSEAIYEFVDKVAYFACAANIIMENYTASDGEPFYRELMGDFREFVKLYQRLAEYSGRFYTPIPEIGNHRSDMKETAIPF